MKIYFLKNDASNMVIITDEVTAKVYDAAPTGIFEGIDLYSESTVEDLKNYYESADINDYSEMWCNNEVSYTDIEPELEDAELIAEF